MANREKKRGRWKYKNWNISGTKRALQMKSKTFFMVFGGLSFDGKIKNCRHKLIKIATK